VLRYLRLLAARAFSGTRTCKMALDRDIYWVGRQWAVTGYGLQAVDQRQKGTFDIEASRLWEDGGLKSIRAEKWLNIDDFDKALSVARKHFPEPPREGASPQEKAAPLGEIVSGLKKANSKQSPIEPPTAAAQKFDMRIEGWPAKFVRPWRIRIRR
jgi:hypothetical protein